MPDKDKLQTLESDLKDYPAILSPKQVAEILGVSRRTVDDYIKEGNIQAFALDGKKKRKQYRVTKANLVAYITNISTIQEETNHE